MSNHNSKLQLNNTTLQTILSKINDLPEESSGIELPELSNEGSAADLLSGKELIDSDGKVVTGEIPTKTATDVSANGATVTIPAGYYASQATKSVTTATRADTTISVTADDTNDKLTIIGSNNQTTGYVTGANKTASTTVTLTTSGKTVTATATNGTKVSKDVASGSAKTPATTITKTPSITVNSSGLITASVSGTQSVTPTVTAGYVSNGTAGTITVSGSATKQLTTQAAKTITPTKSSQTAVASGVYTTGAVTVGAIPNEYITTTDATAISDEILQGETAYVKGAKVIGTMSNNGNVLLTMDGIETKIISIPSGYTSGGSVSLDSTIDDEVSEQSDLINQIRNVVDNLPEAGSGGEPILQNKTVTPTTNSQTVTADTGYDGLDVVTVNAIPNTYVQPTAFKPATTYIPTTIDQTIGASTYITGTQTIKGDANLTAGNIKLGVSIFGVNGTLESGGGGSGGGDSSLTDYIQNGINGQYTNNDAIKIGQGAFAFCSNITAANFPLCISIYNSAFYSCNNLASISFPQATSMGSSAFYACRKLTSVDFPNVTSIGSGAFNTCVALTNAQFPVCTSVYGGAFYSCNALLSISFPNLINIGSSAFYFCSKLTSVNFPKVTSIGSGAFSRCFTLSAIVLGASTLCTLSNSNAFASTPFAGYSNYFSGTPAIYVPASLVDAYKTATNWTYFADKIVGF